MAKPNTTRLAARGSASYTAGAHLHKHGPLTERELFAAVPFARQSEGAADVLQRALRAGWLVERIDGKIDVSTFARAHYDKLAVEAEHPVGQMAAVRTVNVFASPPLSKRYIPNPRGTRQDIPAWSVRAAGTSFYKA